MTAHIQMQTAWFQREGIVTRARLPKGKPTSVLTVLPARWRSTKQLKASPGEPSLAKPDATS